MDGKIKLINYYYYLFTDILNKIEHKKYCYMETGSFIQLYFQGIRKGNICHTMQTYWKEILLRAHFTSVLSIIRNQKWLSGVVMGIESKNLMVFSASLRGFLESVVDSYYSIEQLPTSLSLNYKSINKAVRGECNQIFFSEELEDKLIHFQFAKKTKDKYNNAKKALTNAEYIDFFDMWSDVKTKELYSMLCEITHPASRSLSCFTSKVVVSESYSYATTSSSTDNEQIFEIIHDYGDEIVQLMKMSLPAPVICLKILSMYDFEDVKSEYVNECDINNIISEKSWNEILEMMEKGTDYFK